MLLVRQSCDSDSWICPDWDGLWGVFEGVSQYLLPSSQYSGNQASPAPDDDGQVYAGEQESENQKETNQTPSIEPAIEINVLGSSDQQQCEGFSGSEFVSVSHTLLPQKREYFVEKLLKKKNVPPEKVLTVRYLGGYKSASV